MARRDRAASCVGGSYSIDLLREPLAVVFAWLPWCVALRAVGRPGHDLLDSVSAGGAPWPAPQPTSQRMSFCDRGVRGLAACFLIPPLSVAPSISGLIRYSPARVLPYQIEAKDIAAGNMVNATIGELVVCVESDLHLDNGFVTNNGY